MDAATAQAFERTALLAPHPVAVATGRILRARTVPDRLDAVLRAGEATTRYAAALALASFCTRTDPSLVVPAGLNEFDGPLSWGHFLSVLEIISAMDGDPHVLASTLRAAFQPNKQKVRPAGDPLRALLGIRNELGHDLLSISTAKAEVVFQSQEPDQLLVASLSGLQQLLGMPLFVFEEQHFSHGQIRARRLTLMGESDNPKPEEIVLSQPLLENGAPYVGRRKDVINLLPWVRWDLADKRLTYAIFVIHNITDKVVKFKSMYGDNLERNGALRQMVVALRNGSLQSLEQSNLADGRSFAAEWGENSRQQEQILAQRGGPMPWARCDTTTLAWYAARLPDAESGQNPHIVIRATLLNDREFLRADEITQLLLLFGTPDTVRQTLGREMLDCRARGRSSERWDQRLLLDKNVIESLRESVQFFGRHVGIEGVTLDGLEATSGAADYIAMREALVNLFIHQDYMDATAVAQIEIAPERATFLNAGKSLVSQEGLVDGGKSQSRNPLIARALRLIGFAELAGSGLRALQDVWRQARRRPPRFDSNDVANSFTLTLDWRTIPVAVDTFWKERIGVQVTPQQSNILALLSTPDGFTAAEVASATGSLLEDVESDLQHLNVQGLVETSGQKYLLREHLRTLFQPRTEGE